MSLAAEDFAAFFRAVHGVDPFPWQARLARHVAAEGWPDALDIPTGCGKTAAIDVAVFTLALEAGTPIDARRAPVRILFVVDRRLVVDDAFARAEAIAAALRGAAPGTVLHRVAARLAPLAERPDKVLTVARLRGGLPREADWARTPGQPTVLVSTVDQVGSRLLFRGYGISDAMKPVQAGLLGRDALVLLDEAHLSQPFMQTLRDLQTPPWGGTLATQPFGVVSLTATAAAQDMAAPFRLDEADAAHPALARRIEAAKPAELVPVKADAADAAFADAFVQRALALSKAGGGVAPVTGIVVNRVGRAREIHQALGRKLEEAGKADVALLIGRTREAARGEVLDALLPRMRADRDGAASKPLVVVATMCIEAGADVSFDALVTELAPLDCLRQRFGRLNRTGRQASAPAAILAARDQVTSKASDPIYGSAGRETWRFLVGTGAKQDGKGAAQRIDFGIAAASAWLPRGDALVPLVAPRADAPVLLPRDPRLWCCTSPLPETDPAVPLYLHGPDASPADVQVVWRAELEAGDRGAWADRIEACPPVPGEALALPLPEALRWLSGAAAADIADVEGRGERNRDAAPTERTKYILWRGGEAVLGGAGAGAPEASRPRPGDTIVVPAAEGGVDRWGWHPALRERAEDVCDAAMTRRGGRLVLRLSGAVIVGKEGGGHDRAAALDASFAGLADASDREVVAAVRAVIALPEKWRAKLDEAKRPKLVRADATGVPIALVLATDAASEDDAASLAASQPVRLDAHSSGVAATVLRFAQQLGLPEAVSKDLELAALLHDAGKAHPSFQRYMHGGDELAAAGGAVLAKSGSPLGPQVRAASGLPPGARHEVASLRYAEAHPAFAAAHDPALVLWLIGTHHGYGRPFFTDAAWPQEGGTFAAALGDEGRVVQARPALAAAALAARWLDLRDDLSQRLGPWRLAHLEAVLRLADHRRSEAEAVS